MPDLVEDIHAIAQAYRLRLIAREAVAEEALIRAYGATWARLEQDVTDIAQDLQARFLEGEELPAWKIREYERARILLRQTEEEVGRIVAGHGATMERLQAEAVVLGRGATMAMLARAGYQDLVALPNTALVGLVGRLQDGSPLRALLDELGPDAAKQVERALIAGVGRGIGPREVAREVRTALGGNMSRALTISRTEVVGAYRRASAEQAQARRDLLAGWTWLAAVDSTDAPCVVCLAMHGTWHTMNETLDSHPNCRCSAAYLPVDSMADLGPTGEDWFEDQPDEVQRRILGPTAHAAYLNGDVALKDFVQRVNDPRWGPGLRRCSNRGLGITPPPRVPAQHSGQG